MDPRPPSIRPLLSNEPSTLHPPFVQRCYENLNQNKLKHTLIPERQLLNNGELTNPSAEKLSLCVHSIVILVATVRSHFLTVREQYYFYVNFVPVQTCFNFLFVGKQ